MAAPISTLIDISTINHNNLNLIVKKAIQYVERMKSSNRVINGLSFTILPNKTSAIARISLKSSSGNSKFSDDYESPETFPQQLTLACFLFSVAHLTNLGNRAHILCTNSSGRGDTQMSISTKHCKSKLQKKLIEILTNKDYIEDIIIENELKLPENISLIQKDLITQSTSGKISKRDVKRIKTNHSIDEIELYLELENLKENSDVAKSQIPMITFKIFNIEEVMNKLRTNKVAEVLQENVDLLSKRLEGEIIEKTLLEIELKKINKRNLLQRIFNR